MTCSVSVVMSTFDEAENLERSIASVLDQEVADLEFIIVNDGSPDARTAEILAAWQSRDERVRVIRKQNEGLTRALVDACARASGAYIVRIDAGDRHLRGRILKQQRFLDDNRDIAICSCATRFVDEDGEMVFEVCRDDSPVEARRALRADRLADLKGVTHHGSVMFRRSAYEEVGGYRPQFYFAQDVDLWSRMTDRHGIAFLPEVLYEAQFSAQGISGTYSREQLRLGRLIIAMRRRRDAWMNEDELLAAAARIRPGRATPLAKRAGHARGEYFAGCRFEKRNPGKAIEHFRCALRANPLHVKAGFKVLRAEIGRTGTVSS